MRMNQHSGAYVVFGFVVLAVLLIGAAWLVWSGEAPPASEDMTLKERLSACQSVPSGSTQTVTAGSRVFINLPETIYPYENRRFTMDGASAGIVTNGENLTVSDEFARAGCATHLYEFSGTGTVLLDVPSAVSSSPDYHIRFVVEGDEDAATTTGATTTSQ